MAIHCSPNADHLTAFAARELQRLLPQPLDVHLELDARISNGYRIRHRDGASTISANAGEGLLQGAYRLLTQAGWRFGLASDIRAARPADLFDEVRAPWATWRGVQPWNYWLAGRDAWSLADWHDLIDRLPRLGLNGLEIPFYWEEPAWTGFGIEHGAAAVVGGIDLAAVPGLPPGFAGGGRFSCADRPHDGTVEERVAAGQRLLRAISARCRDRGVRLRLGIEVCNLTTIAPDLRATLPVEDRYAGGLLVMPASESARQVFARRLSALQQACPELDTLVLWQSEGGDMRQSPGSPHPADVAMRRELGDLLGESWDDRNGGAPPCSGRCTTPGDADFLGWVRTAHAVAKRDWPGLRLATSGWGCEGLLAAADRVLPTDVNLGGLGFYDPQWTLEGDRTRPYAGIRHRLNHHTLWAEIDQRLWCLQPKPTLIAGVLAGLKRDGVQEVGLLHWQRQAIEPNVAVFAEGLWNEPSPAPLAVWAQDQVGAAGADLTAALSGLETLGMAAFSVVGVGPGSIGLDCYVNPVWQADTRCNGTPLEDEFCQRILDPIDAQLAAITPLWPAIDAALARLSPVADHPRLTWWIRRIRATKTIYHLHGEMVAALRAYDTSARAAPCAAPEALARLAGAERDAVQLVEGLASGAQDRGEQGHVITLANKLLGGIRRLAAAIHRWDRLRLMPAGDALLLAQAGMGTAGQDHLVAQPGCDLRPLDNDIRVRRLGTRGGQWVADASLRLGLSLPPGQQVRVEVGVEQESEWGALHRQTGVRIGGVDAGVLRDGFGRGPDADGGTSVAVDLTVPKDGQVVITAQRQGQWDVQVSWVRVTPIMLPAASTP